MLDGSWRLNIAERTHSRYGQQKNPNERGKRNETKDTEKRYSRTVRLQEKTHVIFVSKKN